MDLVGQNACICAVVPSDYSCPGVMRASVMLSMRSLSSVLQIVNTHNVLRFSTGIIALSNV